MSNELAELTRRPEDNPVLERIETELPPGDAAEQIDAILRRTDAEEIFQSLEAPAFYRLMKRAGWDQAYDLVQYASPDQIQVFLDFDCWQRDRLVPEKMDKWLAALISEASDEQFRQVCRELDPQVLPIYLKSNLVVEHTDEEGRPPEHLEQQGDPELTPDNQYAVIYPEDEDKSGMLRTFFDRLYHVDRVLAWTFLEAVGWELMSEMEEEAYGWRNSRLEEYGFVERHEAVDIYSYVEPVDYRDRIGEGDAEEYAPVDPPDRLDLPDVVRQEFDEEFYVFEVVKSIRNDEDLRRLLFQLRALLNRAMVADGIEPGEIDTGRPVVRRTLGYLSLGFEFVARGDIERAQELVLSRPLKELFQVGYSLTAKLQAKLESLRDEPTLSILEKDELSLLDPDDRAVAESLLRQRPTYAEDRQTFDIFKSQDQLDETAFSVGMIAFKQMWLFGLHAESVAEVGKLVYGDRTLNSPDEVTFDLLFATRLVHFLTDGDEPLDPIDPSTLQDLPSIVRDAPWKDDRNGYFADLIEPIVESAPVATRKLTVRWLRQTLEHLEEEFGDVQNIDEPKYFTSVLLLASE